MSMPRGLSQSPSQGNGYRRAGRLIASIIGLLLLAAAVYAVSSRTDALKQSIEAARTASPFLLLAVIVLPIGNIAVISASFWILTRRFGRVAPVEMFALILSSWLLNHLPLRPGLVGRISYHRIVNKIPVTCALRVVAEQFAIGLLALGIMVLLVSVLAPFGTRIVLGLLLAMGSAIAGIGVLVIRSGTGGTRRLRWSYATAFGFRLLDMTLWVIRYLCLFALVGQPLPLRHAAAVTAVSQAAMLSPVPVGLREWSVGIVHAALAPERLDEFGISVQTLAPGVSADLANRAVELLVSVPLGVIATLWLMRRIRASRSSESQATHLSGAESV